MNNYRQYPFSILLPVLVACGALLACCGALLKQSWLAFVGSSLLPVGIIGTAGVSLFPFLLPSSLDPNVSLTVWDASSSRTTLIVMTLVTAVFMPIVLLYTSWVYYILRGKVTAAFIKEQGDSLY